MHHRPRQRLLRAIPIVVSVLASWAVCAAGAPPAAHRVIVERKIEMLEQRLQSLARAGYRLLDASDGTGGFTRASRFRLHFGRTPSADPAPDYRVVSGSYSGKLAKLLDEAGTEGFRLRPRGVLRKATPNPLGNPATPQAESVVLILERDRMGPPDDFELIAPGTARQFDGELAERARLAFSLAGLRGFHGGWLLVVLARPVVEQSLPGIAAGDEPPYLAIDEREREKLFEAVGAAAKRGFRIVGTVQRAFPSRGDAVLMARATTAERPYSYYFLGHPEPSELEQRLNEGAQAGYRFLPGLDPRVELIMERAPLEVVDVRYRAVFAESATELERAVSAAQGDGFGFAGLHGEWVVLERVGGSAHSGLPRLPAVAQDERDVLGRGGARRHAMVAGLEEDLRAASDLEREARPEVVAELGRRLAHSGSDAVGADARDEIRTDRGATGRGSPHRVGRQGPDLGVVPRHVRVAGDGLGLDVVPVVAQTAIPTGHSRGQYSAPPCNPTPGWTRSPRSACGELYPPAISPNQLLESLSGRPARAGENTSAAIRHDRTGNATRLTSSLLLIRERRARASMPRADARPVTRLPRERPDRWRGGWPRRRDSTAAYPARRWRP
jgi:hypothetical protein